MMIVESSFKNSYCVSEQTNKMLTVDIWGRQGLGAGQRIYFF